MTTFNDTLLRAARGERTAHTPVWYMRQAGRSQPEYRAIKEKYSLEEITHQPELCAYVTRLPVENYNVDAAILYKDIVTPLPNWDRCKNQSRRWSCYFKSNSFSS